MPQRSEPSYPELPHRPDAEIHLRDYWYIILQRRFIVAAVSLTVAMAVGAVTILQTPRYKATALIQISDGKINLAQDVTIQESLTGYDQFSATQQRILESRSLAERVMDRLDLWHDPLFDAQADEKGSGPGPAARAKQAEKLKEMLQVSIVRDTQLVEISYLAPEPELSARLANALAGVYIAYSAEAESGVARNTSAFIRAQIERLQREIEMKEDLLYEYSQREDIVMIDETENIVVQKLEDVNRELTHVQAERAAAEARYQSLQGQDVDSFPDLHRHGAIQNLKRQQAEIQKKHAELAGRFKANYPELKRTRIALEDVQRRLELETADIASKVLASARVEYETVQNREAILLRSLERQRQETRDLANIGSDYTRVKVGLDNQRAMLEQLLRRQSETALSGELNEQQSVTVRLVDGAVVPSERHTPNYLSNLTLGGIVGLLLGTGAAFFLHYWDTSLYNHEDIRRYFRWIPLLGVIPHQSARDSNSGAIRYLPSQGISKRQPHSESALAERFKFLRESILFSSADTLPRTVLVTSSTEGEGKTFVACHLAACFAESGKNVLLVDADLRKPSLQKVFGCERNSEGLSSVLTQRDASAQNYIQATPLPNLSLILAGPRSPAPAELLGSVAMRRLVDRCKETFDLIVVDSAPLLSVVDSHSLAKLCDTVLLVARSGRTSRNAVRASEELIENANGKITGLLLNDVDFDDYAQSYFYSYSHRYVNYSDNVDDKETVRKG